MLDCCIKGGEVVPVLGSDWSLFLVWRASSSAFILLLSLQTKPQLALSQILSQVTELVW